MSVLMTGTDSADFGNADITDNLTEFTVALTVKLTAASASDEVMLSRWSDTDGLRQIIIQVLDTDEVVCLVSDAPSGFGNLYGVKTTGLNLANGSVYRLVFRWSAPRTMTIYANGVSESTIGAFDLGTIVDTGAPSGASNLEVGASESHETTGRPALDGDYSEVAIWDHSVPDWVAEAYGRGFSPNIYRTGGLLYDRMWGTNSANLWGPNQPTHDGSTADHPRVIQAAPALLVPSVAVVADVDALLMVGAL